MILPNPLTRVDMTPLSAARPASGPTNPASGSMPRPPAGGQATR